MRGKLFTRDFLEEGITETPAWDAIGASVLAEASARIGKILNSLPPDTHPNEAMTEREVILPVLKILGWDAILPQQTLSRRRRLDVPDLLLFPSQDHKQSAMKLTSEAERYRLGLAIVESKRWDRPLDRASGDDPDGGAPSSQMLRYLSRAEVLSEGKVSWGILTNGRLWRLYWQRARSRSEEFLEVDLGACVDLTGPHVEAEPIEATQPDHWLKLFLVLFRPQAFAPLSDDPLGRTFLELAHAESRQWEARVSEELGAIVLGEVFPRLVHALAAHDPEAPRVPQPAYLAEVRHAALTLLYRLLFVLYAEDRNLLPVADPRYDDYSLRTIRLDIAERIDHEDAFSATATRYFTHFRDLCRIINAGEAATGVPAYDGGLFEVSSHPILERADIPDAEFAPLLDSLSRQAGAEGRKWINYRDLSVQHLGSIYERLLEYEVVDDGGRPGIRLNPFARRTTGSFYTHDDLVKLVISRTVGPLVAEIKETFAAKAESLAAGPEPRKDRLRKLQDLDPAARILALSICDPAMGSGHFLVSLVDHLADEVLQAMAETEVLVPWAAKGSPYRSPLAQRLEETRRHILASAQGQGWALAPEQLDDRHLVRRVILKRVIYGVDKNPMAVELAKVALWLHTFTVGAPLSFLDHHLRCGDSLYGEWLDDVDRGLREHGALFLGQALAKLAGATQTFREIATVDDTDISDIEASKLLFAQFTGQLEPLRHLLDFWHAARWLRERGDKLAGLTYLLAGSYGDALNAIAKGDIDAPEMPPGGAVHAIRDLLGKTHQIAERERFLHWELAFPSVWGSNGAAGKGFDAIIGNPPWDRMKLQEVEWFAARRPNIAAAQRAADRKRMIDELRKDRDPLWRDYEAAREQAETAAAVARRSGDYPLLSGGDVNIYSLFVERASRLVKPAGVVGLLAPSGIAADLGASEFFRGIATTGRLAALLDFENKKVFFPDIHASFKFCILVFSGSERTFPDAECAFFLHDVKELEDPDRTFRLGPADFVAVNPNTGTAPVFRTRRDAEITTAVYRRLPVLVDRRHDPPTQVWPVRYFTMFHMTNDSALFKTALELQDAGFYPVAGNIWRKGKEEFVPLYEGKMVQMYDHRAASIVVVPENLHRPAQPEPATEGQRRDPNWLPTPQFWVNRSQVSLPTGWALSFKDVTAPTNERTMIAAIIPACGVGNTLALLLPGAGAEHPFAQRASLLLTNLNSFAFDYVARQKVQGQHLNLYIVEQLPVIPRQRFAERIEARIIGDFVAEQVLRLSYTASDLEPFARDLGYDGPPFPWDEEDRRHRMARLDALFFQLYGIERGDADYILNQFPIVRADDERAFGRFLTRDLILAYMNALAAGDLDSTVKLA